MSLSSSTILAHPDLVNAEAVLGLGSFFEGRHGETSDVDLIAIMPTQNVVKKILPYHAHSLDVTICSLPYFIFTFAKSEGAAHWRESLHEAVILKDDTGSLEQCLEWIKTQWQEQRFWTTDAHICATKARLMNLERKLANTAVEEQLQMLHYMSEWTQCAYQLMCLKQKVLPAYNPRLITQHLNREFPELAQKINTLAEASHSEKQVLIAATTQEVLAESFPRINAEGIVFRKPISNMRLKGLVPDELANLI
ncbi:hypothetical protein [Planctobacterium marinum]|uniref:Uncharacterized protein n=1 Tax=Planctobacterium marinum TaxID=1631968 RepID=A0AA48HGF8_9ALTE|nr:hypothetical protein MACH26_03900 [Planctobacterium marinum]